ncbi:MAG TPA: hypothetical protein VJ842_07570 [Pyrinomonadaceae bacterium]|nr:hypothetical protein [Pyrinomonadaceae bacterium]
MTALRAVNGNFNALAHSRSLRGGDGGQSFVLGLLTGFAAFRFVLQSFVVKENLFAARPDEVFVAVNAKNVAVLEFGLGLSPLPICFAGCLSL